MFLFAEEGSSGGLKRSDVVAWYLEQVQDVIESEEELLEKKALVEKVIDRLIYHVSYWNFLLLAKIKTSIL